MALAVTAAAVDTPVAASPAARDSGKPLNWRHDSASAHL